MKKLFLLFPFVLLVAFSFGQLILPKPINLTHGKINTHSGGMSMLSIDSLNQYFNRATYFDTLHVAPAGYVFGSSYYQDTASVLRPFVDATGCHFDGIGPATVTEVLILAGPIRIVGLPDTITVNVYDVDADSLPTTLLGSAKIPTDTLDTAGDYGFFTNVTMNAGITSSFLVTVEYPGINDTISFWSSDPDTSLHHGKGDGLGEKRARQRVLVDFGFGTGWKAVNDIYLYTGWPEGMDADVMFIPIVNIVNGVTEFKNDLFTLKPVSPVPSTGLVSLEYTLQNVAEVSYRVFDGSGRTLIKSNSELKPAASYKETINMSSYSAGTYYITFNAGSKTLTQKMVIAR